MGRFCIITVKRYGQLLCVGNLYAPNDHDINFFTSFYDKLFDLKNDFPEAKIVVGGDFNLVLGQNDSVNRNANNAEKRSKKFILEQNLLLNLKDSYRINNPTGGFTWMRGSCMSRLDIILLSKEATELGVESRLDWGFDISMLCLKRILKLKTLTAEEKDYSGLIQRSWRTQML